MQLKRLTERVREREGKMKVREGELEGGREDGEKKEKQESKLKGKEIIQNELDKK
jgi:hypothetical protein